MCLDSGAFNQQRGDGRLGRESSTDREGRREEGRKEERERREGGIDIDQLSKYLMQPVKSSFGDLFSTKAVFFLAKQHHSY